MNGCYDGNECIQWHVCRPGSCKVREQVDKLRSQQYEDAQTQAPGYTGEETEIIQHDTGSVQDIYRDTEFIAGQLNVVYTNDPATGELTRAIGNVEPETMSYNVFQFRDDLSLSEEEIAALRERFLQTSNRVAEMWVPSLPPQVVEDHEANSMTRTYPKKHRCPACWLVSLLPGHHRCAHGRLVCEQCELEAGGW